MIVLFIKKIQIKLIVTFISGDRIKPIFTCTKEKNCRKKFQTQFGLSRHIDAKHGKLFD